LEEQKMTTRERFKIAVIIAGLIVAALGLAWMVSERGNEHVVLVSPKDGGAGINRAIERLAARGGEVRLGAGVYLCDAPIMLRHNNLVLKGAGRATLLSLGLNANCPVVVIGDDANDPRRIVSGVAISDLAIDGNREQQQGECWNGVCDTGAHTSLRNSGIVVRRAENATIERVSIAKCRSGGVVTEKGCRRLLIRGLECSENEFDGLACYETEDSVMEDLFLHDNRSAGISTDGGFNGNMICNTMLIRNGSHGIFMRNSRRNLMQGTVIRGSGRQGIFLDQVDQNTATGASGNTFVGLVIEGSGGPAVRLNAESCRPTVFSGYQFFDNKEDQISEASPGIAQAADRVR
jgi:hypothetical protein